MRRGIARTTLSNREWVRSRRRPRTKRQKVRLDFLATTRSVDFLLSYFAHHATPPRAVGPMRAASGAHRYVTRTRPVSRFAKGVLDALKSSKCVSCRASVEGSERLGTLRTFRTRERAKVRSSVMASNPSGVGSNITHDSHRQNRKTLVTNAASTNPFKSVDGDTAEHDKNGDDAKKKQNLKIPFDAEGAVHAMLTLEADGWKFHQLRREVLLTLESNPENAPKFVIACLEILLQRRNSENAKSVNTADPLAHVLLECLPKPTVALRETVTRPQFDVTKMLTVERFIDAGDRECAARVLVTSMHVTVGNTSATTPFLDPRALTRVAETYGVDLEDLRNALAYGQTYGERDTTRNDASYLTNTYVSKLFRDGNHGPAVTLTLHFSLREFTGADILQTLVANNQFDLCMAISVASTIETHRLLTNICMTTNEHAGYRAAWHCVRDFELHAEFPLVKQRYFESTISRMVEKGQGEAALRYAGEDVKLQHCVIQNLLENGDAVTASEYAQRIGMDVKSVEGFLSEDVVKKSIAERNSKFLQLPDAIRNKTNGVVFVDCEKGLLKAFEVLKHAQVVGLDTEWAADLTVDGDEQGLNDRQKKSKKRWRGRRPKKKKRESSDDDDDDLEEENTGLDDTTADTTAGNNTTTDNSNHQRSTSSLVALLQVATNTDFVFLFDLPALLDKCPHVVTTTLGVILSNDSILKAGFGVSEDLRRLAVVHPPAFGRPEHGGALNGIGPVVDLQHVWASGTRAARADADGVKGRGKGRRRAAATVLKNAERGLGDTVEEDADSDSDSDGGGSSSGSISQHESSSSLCGPWSLPEHYKRKHAVGLSSLSLAVLGKPLDKSTRMSDWSQRPLSERQVAYAALDAWVLVDILRILRAEHGDELDRFSQGVAVNGK